MKCNTCNFSCIKRGDWNRHIKTKKHLNNHDDLHKLVMEQQEQLKKQQEQLNKLSTPIHITIFLDQCKDAMNWEDFVETLELWSPNVVPLIVSKLQEIGVYRRPIHCIQHQVCIKQQNKWEIDAHKVHTILQDTTSGLKQKYLLQWEQNHPEWYQNETETNEYTDICKVEDVHMITTMVNVKN